MNCFDRAYVVHLPNPERRVRMDAQLRKLGLSATYLHADPPAKDFSMSNMRRNPRREFGCALSHIRCVAQALVDGAERPLFLEDDIEFVEDAEQRLGVALGELPSDWDVLYMGGHPRSRVYPVGQALVRVGTFSFAESYALSRKALLPFLSYWFDRVGKPDAMIDLILGEFAAKHRGFCVYPLLTFQPPGVSQISGKHDDKRSLVARGWQNNYCSKFL